MGLTVKIILSLKKESLNSGNSLKMIKMKLNSIAKYT